MKTHIRTRAHTIHSRACAHSYIHAYEPTLHTRKRTHSSHMHTPLPLTSQGGESMRYYQPRLGPWVLSRMPASPPSMPPSRCRPPPLRMFTPRHPRPRPSLLPWTLPARTFTRTNALRAEAAAAAPWATRRLRSLFFPRSRAIRSAARCTGTTRRPQRRQGGSDFVTVGGGVWRPCQDAEAV